MENIVALKTKVQVKQATSLVACTWPTPRRNSKEGNDNVSGCICNRGDVRLKLVSNVNTDQGIVSKSP